MMRRAHIINGIILIGIGLLLLASVFLGFTDIPLIVIGLVIVSIGAPLQFNKSLSKQGGWKWEFEEVYGLKYWIKFTLAMIVSIICALFTLAHHDPTNIGAVVIGMGFAAIMMAFVNPRYVRKDLPAKSKSHPRF